LTRSALHALLVDHRETIARRYLSTVRREAADPRGASAEQVLDDLRRYLDGLARNLRDAPGATVRDRAAARDAPARPHERPCWPPNLPPAALVREYGVLRECIFVALKESSDEPTLDEWNGLARCLTTDLSEAVHEFGRRREGEVAAAREQVIAAVSHDLKNPLGLVLGSAALLEKTEAVDVVDGLWVAKLARSIGRAVHRMNRLVTDLHDLSRFEAGRPALALTRERASELLRAASEAIRPFAEAKCVALAVEAGAEEALVCDRERILQVLTNLLGNAVRFSPPGSAVALRAEAAAGRVEFSVRDQGHGIAAPQLSHLFDRYWQAARTERGGAGLGLALARTIVEAHRGVMRVESALGVGSAFSFSLPLEAPPE